MATAELAERFGLDVEVVPNEARRFDGHLFLFAGRLGLFAAPDRLRFAVADRRPAETAFVLCAGEASDEWTYVGVGRWLDDDACWATPELDFATWRRVGSEKTASRRLPDGALERARALAARVVATRTGGWIEARGKRCRVVRGSQDGGLRVDGGDGGFAERTVSLTDIGWVLVAEDRADSGSLDEGRVNRERYLAGTPKESTRWIDTGWALVIVAAHRIQ